MNATLTNRRLLLLIIRSSTCSFRPSLQLAQMAFPLGQSWPTRPERFDLLDKRRQPRPISGCGGECSFDGSISNVRIVQFRFQRLYLRDFTFFSIMHIPEHVSQLLQSVVRAVPATVLPRVVVVAHVLSAKRVSCALGSDQSNKGYATTMGA